MPSKIARRHYNLVDDSYDTRVPLHNEDVFKHGISFKAKYIGSLDVQRPSARTEIVVAMRNIRYEFKAKQVKKRKVNVSVSIDGVRINLRKKRKKKNQWIMDEENTLLMNDPVYRIFYVSHDSHDLKIWSYIARDGSSNRFRCNVFKSSRKKQAMHIVRTIGQAFEVCHKFNPQSSTANNQKKIEATINSSEVEKKVEPEETDIDDVEIGGGDAASDGARKGVTDLDSALKLNELNKKLRSSPAVPPTNNTSNSSHFEVELMRQKITLAEQQAEITSAQVKYLKEQVEVENAAKVETQARNHQLLIQNRELITLLGNLLAHLKVIEQRPDHLGSGDGVSPLVEEANSFLSTPITASMIHSNNLPAITMIKNMGFPNDSSSTETEVPFISSVVRNLHSVSLQNGSTTMNESVSTILHTTTESSDESSSTSSSNSEESDRALIKSDTSPRNDTVDTSVWTELATPSALHQHTTDSLFRHVTPTSVTDTTSSHANGFTISPILSPKEDSPRNNIGSPIRWRSLTSPNTATTDSVVIPRIDPPPRVDRISSKNDPALHLGEDSQNDPRRFPSNPIQDDESSVSVQKLFDFDSPSHKRRLRYEPLYKLQSSNSAGHVRRNEAPAILNGNPSCILTTSFNDDIETTVGSILDQAGPCNDMFSSDFWESDFIAQRSSSSHHETNLNIS